jgi:hypothetical protein
MLLPLLAAGAALFGLYEYDKKKKAAALQAQLSTPPAGYQAPAAGITYPQATTVLDPSHQSTQASVIRYQAAQPMPSGKYYTPADGDIASIVSLRFDPETDNRGKLLPGKTGNTWMADLGKLNGFLALSDLGPWVKQKKPLHLPASATDKGPRAGATGSISGG